MADRFVDRRDKDNRNTSINRQKFLDRMSPDIFNHLQTDFYAISIKHRNISGVLKKSELLEEPEFVYNRKDGVYHYVATQNKKYRVGDKIEKHHSGGFADSYSPGQGDQGFELKPEELEELIMNGIRLPNFKPKEAMIVDKKRHRGGYQNEGNPAQLDVKKSTLKRIARSQAFAAQIEAKIKELEEKLFAYEMEESDLYDDCSSRQRLRQAIKETKKEIEELKKRKGVVLQSFEKKDLQYRSHFYTEEKATKAVVFFIMDVSGSMFDYKRLLAKIGMSVLTNVLQRSYRHLDVVYIKHHSLAIQCTEKEFFDSHESGSTIISPALELTDKIIKEHYSPSKYNIYIIQAGDGENSHYDNDRVRNLLMELVPKTQLYSFLAIHPTGYAQALIDTVRFVQDQFKSGYVTLNIVRHINDWKQYFTEVFHGKE